MRWIPWLLPIGVAIAILHDWHHLRPGDLATQLALGVGALSIVLAAVATRVSRPRPSQPGTFVLCCIIGALAMWRASTQLMWIGAFSTVDSSSLRDVWYPLFIGVGCAIAAIAVGRPPRR